MTLDEFERTVVQDCLASPRVVGFSISGTGMTWLRMRIGLQDGSFIEAYHNKSTGRTAFALIKGEQRIFGADNTGGWHWHPFEAPDEHTLVSGEISFREFLERVEAHLG